MKSLPSLFRIKDKLVEHIICLNYIIDESYFKKLLSGANKMYYTF